MKEKKTTTITILAALTVFVLLFLSLDSDKDSENIVQWRGKAVIDTGPAIRGNWRQNESRFFFVDDPNVAFFPNGELAIAWVDQTKKDILFQRFSPDGKPKLSAPINVSGSSEIFSWLPKVATSPDNPGTVYILWQEIIFSGGSHGGDILFARSEDFGATFSKPVNLSQSIGGAGKGRVYKDFWENGSLDLAVGDNDDIYAVWTEYNGSLWISRSIDGGKTFLQKNKIEHDPALPARAPSIALGKEGVVYVAWSVGENDNGDIHLIKSTDAGKEFSSPSVVFKSDGYSDVPKIAIDQNNTLHLAYSQGAAGPFSRFSVNYTRSNDEGKSFKAPRVISNPLPQDVVSARYPDIGIDGKGNITVVWELFPNPKARPQGLGMTVSMDGGESFALARRVPESRPQKGGQNGSQQGLLMGKLAVSQKGEIAVVNSSFNPKEESRVWLMRGFLRSGD